MTDLHNLIARRLEAELTGGKGAWPWLVLAALDGESELEAQLVAGAAGGAASSPVDASAPAAPPPRKAFLSEISVKGFRGIGPEALLPLSPGPGLTLVVGRNGCGKSSFAEAAEMLITGRNSRWEERKTVEWKDGFRNLHQPEASIAATFTVEGGAPTRIQYDWPADGGVNDFTGAVLVRGESPASVASLGWQSVVELYRPVLSYNELGSMLDTPSRFYDMLSRILGLDVLAEAGQRLRQARTTRDKTVKTAKDALEALRPGLEASADPRAAQVLQLIGKKGADLDRITTVLMGDASTQTAASVLKTLRDILALPEPSVADIEAAIAACETSDRARREASSGLAARANDLAGVLQSALAFHTAHGDGPCPVCGRDDAMNAVWHQERATQMEELQRQAKDVTTAQNAWQAAVMRVRTLAAASIAVLRAAGEMGLPAAPVLAAQAALEPALRPDALPATLIEASRRHLPELREALVALRTAAADELKSREDLWRPLAERLQAWLVQAREAAQASAVLGDLKKAETWMKDATEDLRNERFRPVADEVKRLWGLLRHRSNVSLEDIRLTGTATRRAVQLDVTVDGAAAGAIGVMSQGELHALALSLFLPRAMMSESPFGFVLIDDPVQSMDPARVDGLARVLNEAATTRQIVVFTHDDRLPESVRRQGIEATVLEVTRGDQSVVRVGRQIEPADRFIEDANALKRTEGLPADARRRVIPGLCRMAIEAATVRVLRARWLTRGYTRESVEQRIDDAEKLNTKLAQLFFNDPERAGDVPAALKSKVGPTAPEIVRAVNRGTHVDDAETDVEQLVDGTYALVKSIKAMS